MKIKYILKLNIYNSTLANDNHEPLFQVPDHDLSACTDEPRVRSRVNQHNRFTQIREKCTEIFAKNVGRKKPPPPVLPRPRCNSHELPSGEQVARFPRTFSAPNRNLLRSSVPKQVEMREIGNIGEEEFEIICFEDADQVAQEDGERVRNWRGQRPVEPLDLRGGPDHQRHQSVESLDSGCDIETPRTSTVENSFHQLSGESLRSKKDYSRLDSMDFGVELRSNKTRHGSRDEKYACPSSKNCSYLSRRLSLGQVPIVDQQLQRDTNRLENLKISEREEDSDCSSEDLLPFKERFKLFEPPKQDQLDRSETTRYAQELRQKLAWRVVAERVIAESNVETTNETSSRSSSPRYHDPELDSFLDRCIRITNSVHDNLSGRPDDSLLEYFLPRTITVPELEFDVGSVVSPSDQSSGGSICWSEGEVEELDEN